jgi:predicted permease
VRDPDELVAFHYGTKPFLTSLTVFDQLREANRTLDDIFAFSSRQSNCPPLFPEVECLGGGNLFVNKEGGIADVQYVSGNYFTALGIRAFRGRTIAEDDDRLAAEPIGMLSYLYWQRRFHGDPSIVGTSALLDDQAVTIIGILPDGVKDPLSFGIDSANLLLPLAMEQRTEERQRNALRRAGFPNYWQKMPKTNWLGVMGRRKRGITDAQIQSNFASVSSEAPKLEWDSFLATLPPAERSDPYLTKRRGFPPAKISSGSRGVFEVPEGLRLAVAILATIGGIVFIVVCLNVTNLLLASLAVRKLEIEVRWSLGASRRRLMRQLLTESFLLAFLGGLLGLVVSHWPAFLFGLIRDVVPIARPTRIVGRDVTAVVGCLSLVAGVVFGFGPAIRAIAPDRKLAFRRIVPFGGSRSRLARGLLMTQVGLSVALLLAAGLFVRSAHNIRNLDLGFDPNGVAVFVVNPGVQGYNDARITELYRAILGRLTAIPGVQVATYSDHLLLGEGWPSSVPVYSSGIGQRNQDSSTEIRTVDPNFFATMRIPLRLGRLFTDLDNQVASHVAIANEAFARSFFPNANPIGMHISFGSNPKQIRPVEIVGIVADTKTKKNDIAMVASPMLYTVALQEPLGRAAFAVRTSGNVDTVLAAVPGAVHSVDPSLPITGLFRHSFITEWAVTGAERIVLGALTEIAAGLALAFAMVGLFSLMSYIVARRTTEIGIRMSLGARRLDILLSVMRETLTIVGIGVIVGLCFGFVLMPVLNSQFVGLSSHDPGTTAAVVAMIFFVSAIAGYLPARRASNVDPLTALRYE